jgi:hypothetical protein
MNILQGKSNQFLREAILEGSIDKARRYLTLKIGKAEVRATTEVHTFFFFTLFVAISTYRT